MVCLSSVIQKTLDFKQKAGEKMMCHISQDLNLSKPKTRWERYGAWGIGAYGVRQGQGRADPEAAVVLQANHLPWPLGAAVIRRPARGLQTLNMVICLVLCHGRRWLSVATRPRWYAPMGWARLPFLSAVKYWSGCQCSSAYLSRAESRLNESNGRIQQVVQRAGTASALFPFATYLRCLR